MTTLRLLSSDKERRRVDLDCRRSEAIAKSRDIPPGKLVRSSIVEFPILTLPQLVDGRFMSRSKQAEKSNQKQETTIIVVERKKDWLSKVLDSLPSSPDHSPVFFLLAGHRPQRVSMVLLHLTSQPQWIQQQQLFTSLMAITIGHG